MMVWKIIFLFQWHILRFHVKLSGCKFIILQCFFIMSPLPLTRPSQQPLHRHHQKNKTSSKTYPSNKSIQFNHFQHIFTLPPAPFLFYTPQKKSSDISFLKANGPEVSQSSLVSTQQPLSLGLKLKLTSKIGYHLWDFDIFWHRTNGEVLARQSSDHKGSFQKLNHAKPTEKG